MDVIVTIGDGQDLQTTTVVDSVESIGILQAEEDSRAPRENSIIGAVVMTTVPVAHLLRIVMVAVVTIGMTAVGVVHHREAVKTAMTRLELEMNPHCLYPGERQNKSRTFSSSLSIKLIGK